MTIGAFPPVVVETIVNRDQGMCVRCGKQVTHLERGTAWSIQHRKPRGMGGAGVKAAAEFESPANGIVLCGSATTGCHGWAETERKLASQLGYALSRISVLRPEDVPVEHAVHGRVYLTVDGGVRAAT